MAWIVVVGVLAFPVIEITLFVKSSQLIGILPTIAAAVLAGIAGVALVKHQGIRTALAARAQLDRGEVPLRHAFDGLCLAAAGLLLLLPGFLSDLLALLLLVPPVRGGLRRWLATRLQTAGPDGGPPVIEVEYHVMDRPDPPPRT